MIAHARYGHTVSGQGFGEDGLLVPFFQSAYGMSGHPLTFGHATFCQQCAGAGIVNLGHRANIVLIKKQVTRTIEVLVRFVVFSDREEKITEVVFDPSEKASVSRAEEHTSELQSHSFISYAVF